MEYREIRPPRSQRPSRGHTGPPPSYPDTPTSPGFSSQQQQQQQRSLPQRPPNTPNPNLRNVPNVSFQAAERGDRNAPLDDGRIRSFSAYQQHPLPPTPSDLEDVEVGGVTGERVLRKKSLVRPEREKIEPGHRQWYYRNHAAQMEDESKGGVFPSRTSQRIIYKLDADCLKKTSYK